MTPALVACGVWFAASRIVHLGAGLASLRIAWNESHASTAFDAVSLDAHRPVSLLVPAAGADPSALLETIRSLSSIGSVDVEIVVAVRERDDGVRAALAAEWALENAPSPAATRAPDARLLRSRLDERIVEVMERFSPEELSIVDRFLRGATAVTEGYRAEREEHP